MSEVTPEPGVQIVNVRYQFRRGTAAEWTTANPILLSGEPGFETDTDLMKIGDGATAWSELTYISGDSSDTVSWVDVIGKPENFPPSPHTHTTAQVVELDDTLSELMIVPTGVLPPNDLTPGPLYFQKEV